MTVAPVWFLLLEGSPLDVTLLKSHFPTSGFSFDEIDGHFALAAPLFESCSDRHQVKEAAIEFLDALNVTLRLSNPHYNGFTLHGLAERRNGKLNRVMFAAAGAYVIAGVGAVASAGHFTPPPRTHQERLATLLGRDDRVFDIVHALALRPITWPAMAKAYETVVGLMSTKTKPQDARGDYANLVARGWLSADESSNFYHTAAYHKHGHPKAPSRASNPMSYEDACSLIMRLVWRLVDELEPI